MDTLKGIEANRTVALDVLAPKSIMKINLIGKE